MIKAVAAMRITTWPFIDLNITAEVGSWQKQETRKGIDPIAGTLDGGWGFYCWPESVGGETVTRSYSATEANAMIADGSVTNNPVFNRGYEPMLATSATPDEVMYAIAKYVPAVSGAAGGRACRSESCTNRNLNGGMFRNGWVCDEGDESGYAWKHSDMKDKAYYYVYKLYENLVNEGGLK